MVTLNGLLLAPLIVCFPIIIILLVAFRKELEKKASELESQKDTPIDVQKDNPKVVRKSILRKILGWMFRKNEVQRASIVRLIIGILTGVCIYGSLMYGTSLYDSKTDIEISTKIPALLDGAGLYVSLMALIGMVSLYPFFTKRDTSFFAGLTLSFSIFGVYFALKCPETIPFMENLKFHLC